MYDWSDPGAFEDLLAHRRSVGLFREGIDLSDTLLAELIASATKAPSAYNLQNWRFIAVRTPEAKARLQDAAYGQPQIGQASATFILVGVETAYLDIAERLRPAQEAGIVPDSVAKGWTGMAMDSHGADAQLRRDEAVRSASLAAMCLMLAAESRGLASGPMSGFDPQAVSETFGLEEGEIPVMLIAIGEADAAAWPQKPRRPVSEVLSYA